MYIRSDYYDDEMCIQYSGDDMIWVKFRRGLLSNDVVYLCLCYVLPAGTSRQPFVNVSVFDRLLNDMAVFSENNDTCSFYHLR